MCVGEELWIVLSTLALDRIFFGGRTDGLMAMSANNPVEVVTTVPFIHNDDLLPKLGRKLLP